jgi:uncharacterized membrane-anchored protein
MTDTSLTKRMLNKVPEVTAFFWIIKVLCTTVGETAADFLNVSLNFGLTGTSVVTGVLLVIALIFQFRARKYVPALYWLTVALVSVFGTLVTDNLTDKLGVPLQTSTIVFAVLLALTFLVWYLKERTLSIHSIFTRRREAFYWLAILFTFALGTAAGDLMAEGLGLGYAVTGLIIAGLIVIFAVGSKLRLNHVLSFWLIYILTRPLGASIGDLLSQSPTYGGLGLGATVTSYIFLGGIFGLVVYLSLSQRDVIHKKDERIEIAEDTQKGGLIQTVIIVAILIVAGGIGYHLRQAALRAPDTTAAQSTTGTSTTASQTSSLGDLSQFRTITQDTLDKLNAGDQSGATTRIGDLEYAWDQAQARLKPKDTAKWTEIDGKIDTVLRELRAVNPNATTEKAALEALLAALQ